MIPWLFYWHCSANWTIWQGINEMPPVVIAVVEGASFTELALSSVVVVLAWLSLEIRVDSTESVFAKLFGQRVVGLPKLDVVVGKLAVLLQGACASLNLVLAHLRLIFLLEDVVLRLVDVLAVKVVLLGEVL